MSDVNDESGSSDLMVNNLVYKQPVALSLAVNRTYKKMFFQRSAYVGDKSSTAIATWNTGTSYINCDNSYLSFKVRLTGTSTPTASFGSGSAMNIFNECRLTSRSGTELDRLQNANLWSKFDSIYSKPEGNLQTLGSVQGFGPTLSSSDPANLNGVTYKRFVLPLYAISPFFRPMKKQLIPPQLASGLEIQLVLEDFRTALLGISGTTTGYDIEGLYFNLDCVDMTDSVQKTLNYSSSSEGLDYTFERIFTSTSQLPSNQLSISQQVRKAVSQACFATTLTISQADRINIAVDPLCAVPFNYTSFQYRLGALYFPNQEVIDASDGVEAFLIAQQVYDKLKHPYSEGATTLAKFNAKHGVLSASFEKDTSLNLSGLPINNSRVLELNATYEAVAEPLDVITFLQYCVVARSYIDNTAVSI
ncbi:MAG: hypothetical protein WCH21_11045 [Bacteroidota bacterium]